MYSYFLAIRYMASRITSYLAMGSFGIGVAVLIIVTSVMSGFAENMKEKIRGTGSHMVVRKGVGKFIPDYEELMEKIRDVDHVQHVSPRINWPVLYSLKGFGAESRIRFGILTGIDPNLEINTTNIASYVEGDNVRFTYRDGQPDHPGLLVGARPQPGGTARPHQRSSKLQPKLYRVTSSRMTGEKQELQTTFEVVGTYSSGMYDFDNRRLYCSLKAAQDFLNMESYITEIAISVDQYNSDSVLSSAKSDIQNILRNRRGFHANSVKTWKEERSGLLQAVKAERGLTSILLFLVIVVAAFMLLAVLSMMVMEKRRDIGILRSLGGSVWGVSSIFLLEGLIIGVIGTLFGTGLGYLVVTNINGIANTVEDLTGWHPFPSDIYILEKIPAIWNTNTVLLIGGLTLVTSFLFSVFPAIKAARMEPIEAIRHE